MLRTPDQVSKVYGELFTQSKNGGKLFIDSSTVDPKTSQAVSAEGTAQGNQVVDAPVSGGVTAAEAGSLIFMVGGKNDAYENAKTYLQHMGANVYHCGEQSGSGQIAKICNNLILGITMNAVGEGLSLGAKLG
eukprot:UN34327